MKDFAKKEWLGFVVFLAEHNFEKYFDLFLPQSVGRYTHKRKD